MDHGPRRMRMAGVEDLMATKRSVKPRKTQSATPQISPANLTGTARALGVQVVSATRKKVVAEMKIKELHLNRNGRVNGGAIMAFADVLGAIGTIMNLPDGYQTTTLESKTNFFAAGVGPMVTAVSIPLHIGRTTNVWQTTVKNPDGRMVAIVTQTQMVMPPRPASNAG